VLQIIIMSDYSKPTLVYFNLRGRGDVIRLALSQAGVDWAEEGVDYAAMKQGGPDFPFAQAPAFKHNGLRVVQTDAILRYIGREWDMYGANNVEATQIDMIMHGVESMRGEYLKLCYAESFSEEAKQAYVSGHVSATGLAGRNNGAHMQYLEDILGQYVILNIFFL
jgi:glutathione S-transferase